MRLFSQMARHNVAPETSQDAFVAPEGEEVSSGSRAPSAPSRAPRAPRRALGAFSAPLGATVAPRRRLSLGISARLAQWIIRPPRAEYTVDELGPEAFRIPDEAGKFRREDVQLQSSRGERLECSHFTRARPACSGAPAGPAPCVVYLHGNCSSRVEALDVLDELLPRGFSVFCFDFAGSGHSEGEYVTLGHNEEQDLKVVLDHLRNSEGVGPIALWGRSMGAATAILRAAEDREIVACVLDSPYSSLPEVARELARSTRLKVPEWMVGAVLRRVRSEIQPRAHVDIEDLKPIEFAPRATVPALFAVAKDDEFVKSHHTYSLHDAWGGEDRRLVTLGGGHNSSRPQEFRAYAADFLRERLCGPTAVTTDLPESQTRSLPPVICQPSDDGCGSALSTRPPSPRAESEPDGASPPGSPQPRARAPADCAPGPPQGAPGGAWLGPCLGGCLAGVRAAATAGVQAARR